MNRQLKIIIKDQVQDFAILSFVIVGIILLSPLTLIHVIYKSLKKILERA